MSSNLAVDGDRLWRSLMDMAKIGATPAGGCNRQALTDEDKAGRDLFVTWCDNAGLAVRVDAMGNIFARRAGRTDGPAILAGSHLDTQPTGGKFDGVYGVLAGLEVLRTLNDAELETELPFEAVVWTNEEGARFAPAMVGSGVWAGEFTLEDAYSKADKSGATFEAELERIGYRGDAPAAHAPLTGAFEVHIEQGPILEREGKQIGVVTGVQGMRWYDVVIRGDACHAGPTPMESRRDPMRALSVILPKLYQLAADHAPWGRITFGDQTVQPGSRNTVPACVTLSVDIRHPDQSTLDAMHESLHAIVSEAASSSATESDVIDQWNSRAVVFDQGCVDTVRRACQALDYAHMDIVSGAGHDSVYVSRVARAGMVFVPCENGLSHNEAENAAPGDLTAGCNVLLHAMLALDKK